MWMCVCLRSKNERVRRLGWTALKLMFVQSSKVASLIESNDDPIIPLWLSTFTTGRPPPSPLFEKFSPFRAFSIDLCARNPVPSALLTSIRGRHSISLLN